MVICRTVRNASNQNSVYFNFQPNTVDLYSAPRNLRYSAAGLCSRRILKIKANKRVTLSLTVNEQRMIDARRISRQFAAISSVRHTLHVRWSQTEERTSCHDGKFIANRILFECRMCIFLFGFHGRAGKETQIKLTA